MVPILYLAQTFPHFIIQPTTVITMIVIIIVIVIIFNSCVIRAICSCGVVCVLHKVPSLWGKQGLKPSLHPAHQGVYPGVDLKLARGRGTFLLHDDPVSLLSH